MCDRRSLNTAQRLSVQYAVKSREQFSNWNSTLITQCCRASRVTWYNSHVRRNGDRAFETRATYELWNAGAGRVLSGRACVIWNCQESRRGLDFRSAT